MKNLQKKYPYRGWLPKYMSESKIMIETGTFEGDWINTALAYGFKKVISIEIDQYRFDIAKKHFAKEISKNKVYLRHGDSRKILSNVLNEFGDQQVTFWLDAHYRGKSPIIEELEAIKNHHIKNHIILIDDRNDFIKKLYGPITITQIEGELMDINLNYRLTYEKTSKGYNVITAMV